MSSTHNIYCLRCGIQIASWSQYHNFQFKDEYECCGRVWQKRENYWRIGKTTYCGHRPDNNEIKRGGGIKKLKQITKELVSCCFKNKTVFCGECVKELNYKCPKCGKEIKLSRTE